jgi:hypothetical protein
VVIVQPIDEIEVDEEIDETEEAYRIMVLILNIGRTCVLETDEMLGEIFID